jgi:hypothetical protein
MPIPPSAESSDGDFVKGLYLLILLEEVLMPPLVSRSRLSEALDSCSIIELSIGKVPRRTMDRTNLKFVTGLDTFVTHYQ